MTARARSQRARVFRHARGVLLALGLWLVTGAPVLAQQAAPAGVLGGFSRDNGPINITADSLTINDQRKVAIYKGNVVAVQGDNTLRTIELEVHYVNREDEQKGTAKAAKAAAAPAIGEESQQIKRIKAKQKVVMVSTPAGKEEQSATSDEADYNVATQMVELTGNVYIKQGKNVIQGSRVTMNLKTSEYTVDSAPGGAVGAAAAGTKGGRVSTVLFPKKAADKAGDGAAKGDAAQPAGKAGAPTAAPASTPAVNKQPTTSSWTTTTPR